MEILGLVLFMAALIWMSGFFSGSETALYSVSRVKLAYNSDNGDARARRTQKLLSPIGPTIITILIGNNVVAELLARTAENKLSAWGAGPWSVPLATVLLTPVVLIFAEFLPKRAARLYADRLAPQASYILFILRWILVIPVAIAQGAVRFFQFLIPGSSDDDLWEPHVSRLNLRTFFKAQGDTPALSEVQQQLVDRVLALEVVNVGYEGVSKPLNVVDGRIDGNMSAGEAREGLGPKYFQRYVLTEGPNGPPIGYVSAATLVTMEETEYLKDHAHALPKLPMDTPVHQALRIMHAAGSDLALITNEAGIPTRLVFRGDCLRVLLQMG